MGIFIGKFQPYAGAYIPSPQILTNVPPYVNYWLEKKKNKKTVCIYVVVYVEFL